LTLKLEAILNYLLQSKLILYLIC